MITSAGTLLVIISFQDGPTFLSDQSKDFLKWFSCRSEQNGKVTNGDCKRIKMFIWHYFNQY